MSLPPPQNYPVTLNWSPIRIYNVLTGTSFYSPTNNGKSGNWSTPVWPKFNSNISKYDIEIVTDTTDPPTPPVGSKYYPLNYLTDVYIRTGPWFFGNYNRFTYFATENSGKTFTYLVDAKNDDAVIWQIVNKDDLAKAGEVSFEDSILLAYTDPTSKFTYYMDFEPKKTGFDIDMNIPITAGSEFQLLLFRPV